MRSFFFQKKGGALVRFAALWSCMASFGMPSIAGETTVGDNGRPVLSEKILFIGNSLLYTNNVPALFAAFLSNTFPGKRIAIDMVASGGASIAERSSNERLKNRVFQTRYQTIILQERGGATLCVLDEADRAEPECAKLIAAHLQLAKWGQRTGAKVYYLGTYQKLPKVSANLVESEKWISQKIGAEYIEFSEGWNRIRLQNPKLPWFYADNAHPGMSTSLLYAAWIFQSIQHRLPAPDRLCTPHPLYEPNGFPEKYVHMDPVADPTGNALHCIDDQDGLLEILSGLQDPRD